MVPLTYCLDGERQEISSNREELTSDGILAQPIASSERFDNIHWRESLKKGGSPDWSCS